MQIHFQNKKKRKGASSGQIQKLTFTLLILLVCASGVGYYTWRIIGVKSHVQTLENTADPASSYTPTSFFDLLTKGDNQAPFGIPDVENINYEKLKEAVQAVNRNNYAEAITDFSLIPSDSVLYSQAEESIKILQAQEVHESMTRNEVLTLVASAKQGDEHDQYQEALTDYYDAYQIASADPVLAKQTVLLTQIQTAMAKEKSIIAQQLAITPTPTFQLRVPILMYHYIRVNPNPNDRLGFDLSVTPTDFDQQMAYLAANHYTPISVADVVYALRHKSALPSKPIVITFDDGYDDFYTLALPILEKYDLKGEAFIITGFVGHIHYMSWQQIKDALATGDVFIGSHTVNHLDLAILPPQEVVNELTQSKATLESQLGIHITDFNYPSGEYNAFTLQEAQNAGYSDAVTTQPGTWHNPSQLFTLTRVRVSGGESLQTFIASL